MPNTPQNQLKYLKIFVRELSANYAYFVITMLNLWPTVEVAIHTILYIRQVYPAGKRTGNPTDQVSLRLTAIYCLLQQICLSAGRSTMYRCIVPGIPDCSNTLQPSLKMRVSS